MPENINWNNVDIREKVQQSRRFAIAVQQAMYRAWQRRFRECAIGASRKLLT